MTAGMPQSKRMFASAVSALTLLLCTVAAAQAQEKPEPLAEQAADKWLVLVDSGKYAQSWDEAAQLFRAAVTHALWQRALHASRDPSGKVISRKVKSATFTQSLAGAPDDKYQVIQYESSFEHKQTAVETVTPTLDKDGTWRVSGYYIK